MNALFTGDDYAKTMAAFGIVSAFAAAVPVYGPTVTTVWNVSI